MSRRFDDVLNEIREILEAEGRVAYRMLKRRFELDDEDIEDIKSELIDAKQLAHDEQGKVIVWGNAAQASATDDHHGLPVNADRRLLSVMFCDVVGSTGLSEQLDAEELRDVIRQYQQLCTEVIQRYDGHVAQYLGDGLLVYFGYPIAQEDEAYQAVLSGLEILRQLRNATTITEKLGSPMRVRVGVHTGPVVVGEMGGGQGRTEHLALGETPNIAARVQSAARPDELLVSESTHRLIEGLFKVEPLGAQSLKGVSKDYDLFRVIEEKTLESQFEVALSTGRLTRFVGQDEELSLIRQDWEQAKKRNGQVILLSAEPGMGKSRLAQEFRERISLEATRRLTVRCSPYHTTSPLYPIIAVAQQVFSFNADDTPEQHIAKVEATLSEYEFSRSDAVELVCELLSLPHPAIDPSRKGFSHERRQDLFLVLIEWFVQESASDPVFAIWDDLHWADPSTLELLDLYLEHVPTSATLAMLIYRSNFTPTWKTRGYFRHLSLNRLSDSHIEDLIADVADDTDLPTRLTDHIKERTDGIPLYVEELTRSIVDTGALKDIADSNDDDVIDRIQIPMTLQDSLEARLDRCPQGKTIAQWGATIGREFSLGLLRNVVDDENLVRGGIAELLDAELIYRSGTPSRPTFIFKHALLRDTAYESLLIRRRRAYHARIAEALANVDNGAQNSQPEVIAYHYTEGERYDAAVEYWSRAARRANERSASHEAMGHLAQGLGVLQRLPRTNERARRELELQLLRGTLTITTRGNTAAEVETIYQRALEICDEIDGQVDRTAAYFGLRSYYLTKGELSAAHEVSQALFDAASGSGDTDALLEAHVALANNYFFTGDFDHAVEHASAATELYDFEQHQRHVDTYGTDPAVFAHARLGTVARWRGQSRTARSHFDVALEIAGKIDHPYTLGHVWSQLAWVHMWASEYSDAGAVAEQTLALAHEHDFKFYHAGMLVLRGYLKAQAGDSAAGLADIESGCAQIAALESHVVMPLMTTLHAEAFRFSGDPERGLALLPHAFEQARKTGALYIDSHMFLVKGRLLRDAKLNVEARRAFEQSIEAARPRGLLELECQGLVELARISRDDGATRFDTTRLGSVYAMLREEPESPMLRDAAAILQT